MTNNVFGIPDVKVHGSGLVKEPTPMGRFIGDVLEHVLPEGGNRHAAKQFLAAEFMVRLRAKDGFPSEERRKFINAVLDEFNVTDGREVRKRWLIERLHNVMREFEAAVDEPHN